MRPGRRPRAARGGSAGRGGEGLTTGSGCYQQVPETEEVVAEEGEAEEETQEVLAEMFDLRKHSLKLRGKKWPSRSSI